MILVFVETDAAGAAEPSLEAVTFARDLVTRETGDLAGQPIHALVVGDLPAGTLEQLGAHGVQRGAPRRRGRVRRVRRAPPGPPPCRPPSRAPARSR